MGKPKLKIATTAPWMRAKTDTPSLGMLPSTSKLKLAIDDTRWKRHLASKEKTDELKQREYTQKQVLDNTKTTGLTYIADALHGMGEGTMMLNPYTTAAYFGSKALGNLYSAYTAPKEEKEQSKDNMYLAIANAGFAAMPWAGQWLPRLIGSVEAVGRGVNKGMQVLNSPLTGNWTLFGNKEVRLAPGYIGMNGGSPLETRPVYNSVEDLVNQNTVLRSNGTRAISLQGAARALNSDLDQVVYNIREDAPISFGRSTEGVSDLGAMWEELPGAFLEAVLENSRQLANKGLLPKAVTNDAQGVPISNTDRFFHTQGPIRNDAEDALGRILQRDEGVISMEEVQDALLKRLGRNLTEEEAMELSDYGALSRPIFNEAGDKTSSVATSLEFDYFRNGINRILNNSTLEPYITTRNLKAGESPYKLEELVENGRLRPNTALEEIHSGARGEDNFFDIGDDAVTRASKYFRTKYGTLDRNSLGNVSEDNPMDRSGVIVTTGGGLYSIDSFNHALKYFFRSLRKGRNFYPIQARTTHTRANNLGQLNRYEDLTSPELQQILKESKGKLPDDIKVTKLDSGTLLFSRIENGMRRGLGKLRVRDPLDIIKTPNEQISKINEMFGLNIPLAEVNPSGKIMWPNIYGILYKKGGKI